MQTKPVHYQAVRDSLPVFFAYFPLGLVWGLLWEQAGLSPLLGVIYSCFVFAGAVQFLALSFITAGEPLLGAILTVLPIALRNTFYTVSTLDRLPKQRFLRVVLSFMMVDATYAILISKDDHLFKNPWYYLPLAILVHLYWILGTAVGAGMGELLPDGLSSLDFSLTALITVLALEQYQKVCSLQPLLITAIASAIAVAFFGSSWLLPALVLCTLAALYSRKGGACCG